MWSGDLRKEVNANCDDTQNWILMYVSKGRLEAATILLKRTNLKGDQGDHNLFEPF
jgi:hypothetical protein